MKSISICREDGTVQAGGTRIEQVGPGPLTDRNGEIIPAKRPYLPLAGIYLAIAAVTALHYFTSPHQFHLHDIYRRLYRRRRRGPRDDRQLVHLGLPRPTAGTRVRGEGLPVPRRGPGRGHLGGVVPARGAGGHRAVVRHPRSAVGRAVRPGAGPGAPPTGACCSPIAWPPSSCARSRSWRPATTTSSSGPSPRCTRPSATPRPWSTSAPPSMGSPDRRGSEDDLPWTA